MADENNTDDPLQDGQPPLPEQGISPITIEDEMKRSYLDYAMSVIVSRAIPDVRDGLKPVHRRILYSMHENGFTRQKPYKKSARVVGDVIGKYHPHGDSAVYDALVRMAQDFSMRLPLLDGQGNFGSVDGDPPAAMRYTEVRMDNPAASLLADIEKNTVNFQDNYDASESEPVVLPARFPNILVNGAGGIAVGMATNIAPHNLGEVCDAAISLLTGELSDAELLDIIPGPDFPTGAMILGRGGARQGVLTGRGTVTLRAKTHVEEIRKNRFAIIATELPFQVNKASMIAKIASLVNDKKIEGISAVRDESDRVGMRVVVELKRDANAEVVLNQLHRFTPLQQNFSSNMLALNGGKPEQMNVRQMLEAFLSFREDVIARRTKFDLSKARDRAHVIVGLATAVANIDEIIRLIRSSANPTDARERLVARNWDARGMGALIKLIDDPRSRLQDDGTIRLTEEQAREILKLQLSKLTALGMEELTEEAEKLAARITDLLSILRSRDRVRTIIREELEEVRERFATPRRTEFVDGDFDFDDEDLIAVEDMVVTVTNNGYVKRTPLDTYRAQHRGGKGRSGMQTKDEDFVTTVFVATTHTPVILFSNTGMAYSLKVWKLPSGGAATRGRSFNQLIPSLDKGETITSIMALPEDEDEWGSLDIMFATRSGGVRRNSLSDFTRINRNGKIAMKPDEDDGIIDVRFCSTQDDIVLTTALGRAIRFPVTDVRRFNSRASTGVRGVRLGVDDEVVSMSVLRHFDATTEERTAYMKHANAMRRALGDETEDATDEDEGVVNDTALSDERLAEMGAAEQFLLTIATDGLGKRASSYAYPAKGRGGKGVVAQDLSRGDADDARLVRSFVVEDTDQVMLATDGGKLIRTPVASIGIVSRSSKGVRVIRTAEDESVVSVERIADAEGDPEDLPEAPVDESGEAAGEGGEA